MKRILLIGTLLSVALLILCSFTGVASSRTVGSNRFIEHLRDRIENNDSIPLVSPNLIFLIPILFMIVYLTWIMFGRWLYDWIEF